VKQAKLIGLLYLENNLAPGYFFTPQRIALLELLASQAADPSLEKRPISMAN